MKRLICALCLVWALCVLPCAQADTEVFITVAVTDQGLPEELFATRQIELAAVSTDAPMPAGAVRGKLVLETLSGGEVRFGPFPLSRVGEYLYTIRQVPGDDVNIQYDEQVFEMKIQVSQGKDELEATVILYQGDEGNKFDRAEFTNVSLLPTTPPPGMETPPPPHSGQLTPTGVHDYWPIYVTGMAILTVISIAMIVVLCRKDVYDEAEDE